MEIPPENHTAAGAPQVRPLAPGMIHMTSTSGLPDGTYAAVCRCPWQGEPRETRNQARTDGDAHLAEANAPGQPR